MMIWMGYGVSTYLDQLELLPLVLASDVGSKVYLSFWSISNQVYFALYLTIHIVRTAKQPLSTLGLFSYDNKFR